MKMNQPLFDNNLWKQKAAAFVTRSHRHLWGKNNEDPLAYLFTRGLKNEFAKKMLVGWNKFGQNRPLENWGLKNEISEGGKLFLPPGIVVPYIKNKQLLSVFIYIYEENRPGKTVLLPGSSPPPLILGKLENQRAKAEDLMEGLFLYQEHENTHCIVIEPDLSDVSGLFSA